MHAATPAPRRRNMFEPPSRDVSPRGFVAAAGCQRLPSPPMFAAQLSPSPMPRSPPPIPRLIAAEC
jgi:hypothetical protein